MERKRVYIAGKLNDMAVDYNKHRARMMHTAADAHEAGFSVFVPSMVEQLAMIKGGWEYDDYFGNSQPWLEVSQAVLLVPGYETSTGTIAEIGLAIKSKIPVFESLENMIDYFIGAPSEALTGLVVEDGIIISKQIVDTYYGEPIYN